MRRAVEVAMDSGCVRGKRGSVIVKDGDILVEAYNTPYPDNNFCQEHGCLRDKLKLGLGRELEKCRAVHSEAKAISLAAQKGINLDGSTLYVTCQPCMNCAKSIIAAGIKTVYYLDKYGDQTPIKLLEKMGIKCQRVQLEDDKPEERLRDATGQ